MSRRGIEPAARSAVERLIKEGKPRVEIHRLTGVSRATVFRIQAQIKTNEK
jgi:DNA invertase Pin-like site-specific DNA recombinase